MVQAARSRNTG